MHTIQKRPVALEDKVVIRPMMYLALSYDHRAVDGKEAVTFLITVKQCIEDPKRLPLDFFSGREIVEPGARHALAEAAFFEERFSNWRICWSSR